MKVLGSSKIRASKFYSNRDFHLVYVLIPPSSLESSSQGTPKKGPRPLYLPALPVAQICKGLEHLAMEGEALTSLFLGVLDGDCWHRWSDGLLMTVGLFLCWWGDGEAVLSEASSPCECLVQSTKFLLHSSEILCSLMINNGHLRAAMMHIVHE